MNFLSSSRVQILILIQYSSNPLNDVQSLTIIPFFISSKANSAAVRPVSFTLINMKLDLDGNTKSPSIFEISSYKNCLDSIPFLIEFSIYSVSLRVFKAATKDSLVNEKTGFSVQEPQEVREEIAQSWINAFKSDDTPDINTAPETPQGQIIDAETYKAGPSIVMRTSLNPMRYIPS